MDKKKFDKLKEFSKWYNDIILKAKLADYSPVKGCMVIRPYGYTLWENIQKSLDTLIKERGIKNAYFPIFIPESFLIKEKEHVEGFAPELAVVTIAGGKELTEKLIVRPTSETIMYFMFAKWIKSWRDLPFFVNQWCNVVRWEKRTYLFLRTTEFLWQEGHTCHVTHAEAIKEINQAISMYTNFYRNYLAIDGLIGKKSKKEKFPGAGNTFTYEMLMSDGKVLQGCTAHDLAQNFSKPFKIQFQDKNNKLKYVWQTSWGLTTRSIGALVMTHGDEQGLILPPKIAPIQVVIIPIIKKHQGQKIKKYVKQIEKKLKNIRTEVDWQEQLSVGWKFNEWELKGVPLRIEVGINEFKKGEVTLVRRDKDKREKVKIEDIVNVVERFLSEIQIELFNRSKKFLKKHTYKIDDYNKFKEIMKTKKGVISAFWCEDSKCEEKIKKETKASIRCLPLDAKKENGKCIYCGKKAQHRWFFAQAY